MERLTRLEKEVVSLRALLIEKEVERDALREKLKIGHGPSIQKMEDYIPQNIALENCSKEPEIVAPPSAVIGDTLSKWAIQRYSRQILLPQISVDGQKKLCAASVLIVGTGGLGCPAAMYLVAAGIGTLGLVDYDVVEESNLHRQTLHTEQNCGRTKVDSAADTLHRLNSHVSIRKHHLQLSSANALQVLSGYDIVLDCTDNMPTRYLLNDACIMLKIPLVSGSALKMEGQLTIYGYRPLDTEKGSDVGPCYRCLFPRPPPPETVGSCAALGVLGPVTAVVGALQALETIKLIVRRPRADLLVSKMLLFDGEDCSFRCVKLRGKNPECAQCSEQAVSELVDYEEFCQARAQEKTELSNKCAKTKRRLDEKRNRMCGRPYLGFRKTDSEKEKYKQDVLKNERKLGPSCTSKLCKKKRSCHTFSEEERKEIFQIFWSQMVWSEKKKYVKNLIQTERPKFRRKYRKNETPLRGDTKIYHLAKNGQKVRVCRIMFLNTLGIKEAMVRTWLAEAKPRPKKKPIISEKVSEYIECLPKFAPKCLQCGQFTERLYLDLHIKNQHQLYKKYFLDMKRQGVEPASRKTFVKVFEAKNFRIFKPKNDGDVCDLFSHHNLTAA